MNEKSQLKTYLALIFTVVFWGLSFVATKIALEDFKPFTLIFARFSVAAGLFLLIMFRRGFPKFSGRDHVKMFFLAVFEPGLYFIFETIGLQHTSAPKTALIIATIPIAVTIGAALFLGEKTRGSNLFGIILSIVGITILVVGDPDFSLSMEGPLFGDLLIIGAVFTAAMYIITARNLGKSHSAFEITSMQIIYGAIFYIPAFIYDLPDIDGSVISGRSLIALFYLTVFATVAAFLCYNYALTQIPASRAAVFINLIPVVTAAGAWILLGETLSALQAFGGAIVLLAIFISNRPHANQKK